MDELLGGAGAMCAWHTARRLLAIPADAAVQQGRLLPGAPVVINGGLVRAADIQLQNPVLQRAEYSFAFG